jgi:hypothetical protein
VSFDAASAALSDRRNDDDRTGSVVCHLVADGAEQ